MKCNFGAAGCAVILCLSACASAPDKTVRVEPLPVVVPASVVLVDPTIDDAMLPAIGEGLSRGQVTLYPLDGPALGTGVRPMPALSNLTPEPVQVVAPLDAAALNAPQKMGGDVAVFPLADQPVMITPPPMPGMNSATMAQNNAMVPMPIIPAKKRPARGMTY